jgi:hypothetical protein
LVPGPWAKNARAYPKEQLKQKGLGHSLSGRESERKKQQTNKNNQKQKNEKRLKSLEMKGDIATSQ